MGRPVTFISATVYTRDGCEPCRKAKTLLASKGIAFQEVKMTRQELTDRFGPDQLFPAIEADGTFVGGFNTLKRLLTEGA